MAKTGDSDIASEQPVLAEQACILERLHIGQVIDQDDAITLGELVAMIRGAAIETLRSKSRIRITAEIQRAGQAQADL